ncbi:hypothetical protein [Humibacter sp.]|uniref:hypothetical protein n=1 Tax=Humibacter sp. TaxID=1940291 RepID=UPI003F80334C
MDQITQRRFDTLCRRHLTPAGNYPAQSVTLGATSLSVTFARAEQDTAFGVSVTPSWLTTVAVPTKTTTGCTVTFGTAAPAGATADVLTWRTES